MGEHGIGGPGPHATGGGCDVSSDDRCSRHLDRRHYGIGRRVDPNDVPAGTYIVNRQGEAIQISDSRGHAAFVISTPVPNPAANLDNQLVFNRYGNDSYLSEVRWLGYSTGRGLAKTTNEVELAKVFSGRNVLSAGLTK